MPSRKRVAIATSFGFLAGLLCYLLGRYVLGYPIDLEAFLMLLAHRTSLGFVLGISGLRWHWAMHGIIIGLILGIPDASFFYMLQGDVGSALYFFFGGVWGLMIEFFTSVVFKERSPSIQK